MESECTFLCSQDLSTGLNYYPDKSSRISVRCILIVSIVVYCLTDSQSEHNLHCQS
jgi:hypothetical protein